jgi:hypothetical protein
MVLLVVLQAANGTSAAHTATKPNAMPIAVIYERIVSASCPDWARMATAHRWRCELGDTVAHSAMQASGSAHRAQDACGQALAGSTYGRQNAIGSDNDPDWAVTIR